ncbi:hypothetical protein MKQ68_17125 [Chitinophaga horti]|uniref:Uncharacterized protein n=1 Tax=Chitinophaga horti TaxID=2920382 RepID=A0ABY6IWZ0_9BACT|nr:hypothetical protein [Chitinophaga horti]UYQ91810.1 hypothetical protein MKQ68_17125 [Chitinophaga horti]
MLRFSFGTSFKSSISRRCVTPFNGSFFTLHHERSEVNIRFSK